MICDKCGREIPEDSKFCVFCGVKLDAAPTEPAEPSEATTSGDLPEPTEPPTPVDSVGTIAPDRPPLETAEGGEQPEVEAEVEAKAEPEPEAEITTPTEPIDTLGAEDVVVENAASPYLQPDAAPTETEAQESMPALTPNAEAVASPYPNTQPDPYASPQVPYGTPPASPYPNPSAGPEYPNAEPSPYGAPQAPYGAPPQSPYYTPQPGGYYGAPQQGYMPVPEQPKKKKTWIILLIVGLVLLCCIGTVVGSIMTYNNWIASGRVLNENPPSNVLPAPPNTNTPNNSEQLSNEEVILDNNMIKITVDTGSGKASEYGDYYEVDLVVENKTEKDIVLMFGYPLTANNSPEPLSAYIAPSIESSGISFSAKQTTTGELTFYTTAGSSGITNLDGSLEIIDIDSFDVLAEYPIKIAKL
jgi:flagellar basal body-associated protein FliL